jgi:predicted dehydrogenase
MISRRDFVKKGGLLSTGLVMGGTAASAKSYRRIVGANDRIQVAIIGLGRRLGAFDGPISKKENNVELSCLCDVMPSQMEKAAERFSSQTDHQPKLENDIRKVLEDKELDAVINATPDHWHAPGSILAMQAGKHVYVEKPISHNMEENRLLVQAAGKYNRVVQAGTQQRSSGHTIEAIHMIHSGAIGRAYKAVAFYTNDRGRVPNQKPAPVPGGLDWNLFQGPAPRRDYTEETWNYNWHWYGWDYGTAESGNNGTHEMDVARWALQVEYPQQVFVDGHKGQFPDDGWEMYDHIEATFRFDGNRSIVWDGRSRVGYDTYSGGRGTIIYGSEGSVFIDRDKALFYDREGNLVKTIDGASSEAGTALGGGGSMSTRHVENFFQAIRGKEELNAPVDNIAISHAMVHFTNVAYRIMDSFEVGDSGIMLNRKAMELWSRDYQPGWEIKF